MDDDLDESIPDLVELDSESILPVANDDEKVIPITILTGFLGAGKTTLLTYILSADHGKRIAVIENELSVGFGVEALVAKSGVTGKNIDGFFELNNGCICCSVKDNLLATLEQLSKHSDRFDYIIIEMTGVANPGPVISSFWLDDALHSSLKLDGIICVVDSVNIERYLEDLDISYDVKMQICYADRVLVNKCDIISIEQANKAEKIVRELNGIADVMRTSLYHKPSVDWVLDINGYATSVDNVQSKGIFNSSSMALSLDGICRPCEPETLSRPHFATMLSTEGIKFSGRMNLTAFERYLDSVMYQGSGGSNQHSTQPTSNMEIFRIKGVIHIENEQYLFILQGVHNIFDLRPSNIVIGSADDTTNGENRVVIIGKNINRPALIKGFQECSTYLSENFN